MGLPCLPAGGTFFGVQNGNTCFVGWNVDEIFRYGYKDAWGYSIACKKPCSGDSSTTCGGAWANEVYAVIANDGFLGCYRDGPDRRLPTLLEKSSTMTVDRCRDLARTNGEDGDGVAWGEGMRLWVGAERGLLVCNCCD